ncbi:hypothetical protein BC937DRAFT_90224 [Endogone sp. FLAS-F59071]|nr:hypothetical protein BC937DRAFT_90224 [Endogone sp. FLAS-F59071]|eukprot:RUS22141.1 hypothetical protein BC937DRAFT_90224 [Endogone sp. FLAS-F59071]
MTRVNQRIRYGIPRAESTVKGMCSLLIARFFSFWDFPLQRVFGALRYTSFFIIINIVLVVIGLFLKPSGESKKIDLDWFKRLLTESSTLRILIVLFGANICLHGEKALSFVIAVLILLGLVIFICYTAPGLSLLPFGLIKGRTKLEEENADLSVQIAVCREKQRAITVKYAHSPADITTKDRKLLEYLEMQERILLQRQRTVDEGQRSYWQTMLRLLRPVEILGGLLLLVLSFVIIGSIFLSSVALFVTSTIKVSTRSPTQSVAVTADTSSAILPYSIPSISFL